MKNMKTDNLILRKLKNEDGVAYRCFAQEFTNADEPPILEGVLNDGSFCDWLKKTIEHSKGINLEKGRVPSTQYYLFRVSDGKIVGTVDIRHKLNKTLLKLGGNIGYSVAPSERRKGHASFMLSEALKICKKMGMEKVLVTCKVENIGSAKTIQKNGGVLENEVILDDGRTEQRYWINL